MCGTTFPWPAVLPSSPPRSASSGAAPPRSMPRTTIRDRLCIRHVVLLPLHQKGHTLPVFMTRLRFITASIRCRVGSCFVTSIGRAGKSISMPTPIGGGTAVTAEENYRPDVQEHFDQGAAPQAHRSAHVHMRRHRRTAVRRAAPVKAGIGQDGGTAALIAGTVRRLVEQGRLAILRGGCLPGRGHGRVIIAPAQP